MIKTLLSLFTSNSKDKKKTIVKGVSNSLFASDADFSILNDTSVTISMGDGFENSSVLSSSQPLGDSSFIASKGRKNRTASFDICLSTQVKPEKDVVVRRRSLQPRTPTPNPSESESFLENIFDSPIHQNRLHSVIGDRIYEASSSPPPCNNKISKKM